jgi:HNH endonuclease
MSGLPPWADQARARDLAILATLTERPGWWRTTVAHRLRLTPQGCVVWTGGKHERGYGHVSIPAPKRFAAKVHRVAWIRHHGTPLPMGHVLDHLCGNKSCLKVEHLDAVTQHENLMRAQAVRGVAA